MSRLVAGKNPTAEEQIKQIKQMQNTGAGKLLFTRQRERMCALLIQEDRLKAAQVLEESPSKIGAIYIAKVKNVVKNIDACFVEIADGELCFLPRKEATMAYLVNRPFDGRILEGDEVLVQVTRDAQKTKQASVTAMLSLSNETFALSLGSTKIGYSAKLSKERKQELADILEKQQIQKGGHLLPLQENASVGLVVRTHAQSVSEEHLLQAWEDIKTQWLTLLQTAMHRTCFTCLVEPPAGFVAVLEQLVYKQEYAEILTDDAALYEQLRTYCKTNLPDKKVRLYTDTTFPLSKLYSLESKLDTALNTRIWLKSGGYLVIEATEALTVIDVNSGKYEGRKDNQDTAYKINQEAAEEIALQLRLRNLSGIIIVDFISMTSKEREQMLLEQLRAAVKTDRQNTRIVDITPLGLVEITRKKSYKTLKEQFK